MSNYTLTHGSHANREEGMCLMEAVAYLAGEPHTYAPECACPVLTEYAIVINDAMGDGPNGDALRARYLHDLAPMLVGSRSTPDVEQARAYVLADHAVRIFAPLALDSAGLGDEAAKLRSLDAVVDKQTAAKASEAVEASMPVEWSSSAMAWVLSPHSGAQAALAAMNATNAAACAAEAAYAAKSAGRASAAAGARTAAWGAARQALVKALEAAP